jgi:hypothetical protein
MQRGTAISHVVTIELEIENIDTLGVAANILGCKLIKEQKNYKWWGHHVGDYPLPDGFTKEMMGKSEHVIKVPGADWEIGVVKDPHNDKKYKLIYDFYGPEGRKIEKVCGDRLGKFKGAYSIAEVSQKLKAKKAKYKEEQKENEKGQKIRRFVINV